MKTEQEIRTMIEMVNAFGIHDTQLVDPAEIQIKALRWVLGEYPPKAPTK